MNIKTKTITFSEFKKYYNIIPLFSIRKNSNFLNSPKIYIDILSTYFPFNSNSNFFFNEDGIKEKDEDIIKTRELFKNFNDLVNHLYYHNLDLFYSYFRKNSRPIPYYNYSKTEEYNKNNKIFNHLKSLKINELKEDFENFVNTYIYQSNLKKIKNLNKNIIIDYKFELKDKIYVVNISSIDALNQQIYEYSLFDIQHEDILTYNINFDKIYLAIYHFKNYHNTIKIKYDQSSDTYIILEQPQYIFFLSKSEAEDYKLSLIKKIIESNKNLFNNKNDFIINF